MSITFILILINVVFSIRGFQDSYFLRQYIFNPYVIARQGEWHRFMSAGFLHANWIHLFFNMWVLFMFGDTVESAFQYHFGSIGKWLYLGMYLLAIPIAETYSFTQHRDNYLYSSLGASGAVSAVVFAFILLQPLQPLYILFIPIGIPAFIFGILYLIYSAYMAKQGGDGIGHDAHFYGALFGFIFPLMLKSQLFFLFIDQILRFTQ